MSHSGLEVYEKTVDVVDTRRPMCIYPLEPIVRVATSSTLADPFYYCPMAINMIIGMDLITKYCITLETVRIKGYPIVTQTILGDIWMVKIGQKIYGKQQITYP